MRLDRWVAPDEQEWQPVAAGVVLNAGNGCEFFIPAADVVEHTADLVRATVDGLVCSFDLHRYGVATITNEGAFWTLDHDRPPVA